MENVARTKSHKKTTVTAHEPPHAKPPAEPQVEPVSYATQARVYALYDQGLNAGLSGDAQTAVNRLTEAAAMMREVKPKLSPTMESMVNYELGRAAERSGQYQVAINAYTQCLQLSPRDTDATARLSSLLIRAGQPMMALMKARDVLQRAPNDPYAHMILSVVLMQSGYPEDARVERDKANMLLNGVGRVTEPTFPSEQKPEESPGTEEMPGATPGSAEDSEHQHAQGLPLPGTEPTFEPKAKFDPLPKLSMPEEDAHASESGKTAPEAGPHSTDTTAGSPAAKPQSPGSSTDSPGAQQRGAGTATGSPAAKPQSPAGGGMDSIKEKPH